jgi:hypothetical protein
MTSGEDPRDPDDLTEAERTLLRPVLDLGVVRPDGPDTDAGHDDAAPVDPDDADPGTGASDTPDEAAALQDFAPHVEAFQTVLDSLTAALDDASVLETPEGAGAEGEGRE